MAAPVELLLQISDQFAGNRMWQDDTAYDSALRLIAFGGPHIGPSDETDHAVVPLDFNAGDDGIANHFWLRKGRGVNTLGHDRNLANCSTDHVTTDRDCRLAIEGADTAKWQRAQVSRPTATQGEESA